jgi:hypothetical protein
LRRLEVKPQLTRLRLSRRNALSLIAPYGHGAKVRAPAAAMALIDQLK